MTEAEARAQLARNHTTGQRLLTELEKMLRLAAGAHTESYTGEAVVLDRGVVRAKLRELDAYLTLIGRTPDA